MLEAEKVMAFVATCDECGREERLEVDGFSATFKRQFLEELDQEGWQIQDGPTGKMVCGNCEL